MASIVYHIGGIYTYLLTWQNFSWVIFTHFINICKRAIHNCKHRRFNDLFVSLSYPQYVHNPLRLRGLGWG